MRCIVLTLSTLLLLLSGCTTQLTEAGSRVELLTPAHAKDCEPVQIFPVKGSSTDDVMNKAFNQVAEMGGDSLGISSGKHDDHGSEITAVALRCHMPAH